MAHFNIFRMGVPGRKFMLALCLLIALGATAVSARRLAGGAALPPAQKDATQEALSVELITITPSGFEPVEMNPARGRFILAVDNRSGQPDVELKLPREAGEKLHQVRVPQEPADWSDVVDLHPGRYALSVVGRPEWTCAINVGARWRGRRAERLTSNQWL